MFGALGILLFSFVGGRLFDGVGPWAPFVLAGSYQSILFVAAILVRIYAPGPKLVEGRGSNWMAAFLANYRKTDKKPGKAPAE